MSHADPTALPPIVRTITVPWDPAEAFDRFAVRFAQWWPWRSHSIGEKRIARIVFDTRVGGLIFEEHHDARRFQWGTVTAWDPPRLVAFTWHPSRDASTAQDVTVEFIPEGAGTLVRLTATGWERWGAGAERAHRMYGPGWDFMLHLWAGRRTPSMLAMSGLMVIARLVQALRGGVNASIARAGGELRDTQTP